MSLTAVILAIPLGLCGGLLCWMGSSSEGGSAAGGLAGLLTLVGALFVAIAGILFLVGAIVFVRSAPTR